MESKRLIALILTIIVVLSAVFLVISISTNNSQSESTKKSPAGGDKIDSTSGKVEFEVLPNNNSNTKK